MASRLYRIEGADLGWPSRTGQDFAENAWWWSTRAEAHRLCLMYGH
ncbi:hypothetical protein PAMC26577_08290 [Caballeronia sordidicola]|uniref:Sema domain-containing protein n=1 Tax=Caballeronia sordidicola TaxID=196367 RepID=A0A242N1S6_CABSO|nr:hypothetical protein PAMC26577_08290 [Caballeronia sordidicola]